MATVPIKESPLEKKLKMYILFWIIGTIWIALMSYGFLVWWFLLWLCLPFLAWIEPEKGKNTSVLDRLKNFRKFKNRNILTLVLFLPALIVLVLSLTSYTQTNITENTIKIEETNNSTPILSKTKLKFDILVSYLWKWEFNIWVDTNLLEKEIRFGAFSKSILYPDTVEEWWMDYSRLYATLQDPKDRNCLDFSCPNSEPINLMYLNTDIKWQGSKQILLFNPVALKYKKSNILKLQTSQYEADNTLAGYISSKVKFEEDKWLVFSFRIKEDSFPWVNISSIILPENCNILQATREIECKKEIFIQNDNMIDK